MPDREKVIDGLIGAIGLTHGYIPKRIWSERYVEQACRDAIALLKEQPDIVRCEDCKYIEHLSWLDDANGFKCYVCRKHTFTGMRTPDWFCADGERR